MYFTGSAVIHCDPLIISASLSFIYSCLLHAGGPQRIHHFGEIIKYVAFKSCGSYEATSYVTSSRIYQTATISLLDKMTTLKAFIQ